MNKQNNTMKLFFDSVTIKNQNIPTVLHDPFLIDEVDLIPGKRPAKDAIKKIFERKMEILKKQQKEVKNNE